jgi:hypothetical protein
MGKGASERTFGDGVRSLECALKKGGTRVASKNVETLRTAHESWNIRDFAGLVRNLAERMVYTEKARALTFNSRDKFSEWTEGWAKAFSDGRITKPEYIDAGEIVIAEFTAEGTNDGPFGSLKPLRHCPDGRFPSMS